MYLNLPIRCPSSGTKNTTLETHTCKSPLSYLGCKNCRTRLFRVFSVFSGVFPLLRRESGSALTNQDTVCWDRCFWLACLFVRNNECTKNLVYRILMRKSLLPIKMKVITIYEIFRHWLHHWRAKSRQNNNIKYFSRFLPNRPRPLSSFDTHARWQPVTQSARSRRSYGKIEDCEQSIIWTKRVNPGDDLEMRTALFVDCSSISCPSCSKNFSLWG